MKPILERKSVREILELSDHPTFDEVKANYRRLVKLYHPDINKTKEAEIYMKRINQAYEIAMGKKPIPAQQPPPPQQGTVIIYYTYTSWTGAASGSGGWF